MLTRKQTVLLTVERAKLLKQPTCQGRVNIRNTQVALVINVHNYFVCQWQPWPEMQID